MAAPEHVPTKATEEVRTYASPPRRDESWWADRPGDLGDEFQPRGDRYGSPGPDQGYALGLARRFSGQLHLTPGEDAVDVTAAGVAVALKRASLFGRAPVVHDMTVAYTVWGLLDAGAPADLVALRRRLFAGVANPNHYPELRRVADAVPSEVLRLTPAQVTASYAGKWAEWLMPTEPEASAAHQ